jgi:hypothetical protein
MVEEEVQAVAALRSYRWGVLKGNFPYNDIMIFWLML